MIHCLLDLMEHSEVMSETIQQQGGGEKDRYKMKGGAMSRLLYYHFTA